MTTKLSSLDAAVDLLNEAAFSGEKLPKLERDRVAEFIAARQGGKGAYADSFALTDREKANGIHVFTGERMTSASARHIAGEECARALRQLKNPPAVVKQALKAADASMKQRIADFIDDAGHPGVFCCGKCTVALWRNVAVGAFGRKDERHCDGVAFLRKRRDGDGGWTRFPFYYTLLALTEMNPRIAREELKYAAKMCERRLKRKPGKDKYAQRRHQVMRRALELVS